MSKHTVTLKLTLETKGEGIPSARDLVRQWREYIGDEILTGKELAEAGDVPPDASVYLSVEDVVSVVQSEPPPNTIRGVITLATQDRPGRMNVFVEWDADTPCSPSAAWMAQTDNFGIARPSQLIGRRVETCPDDQFVYPEGV